MSDGPGGGSCPRARLVGRCSVRATARTRGRQREWVGVYAVSAIRTALAEIRKVLGGRTPTHARLRDTLTVVVVATVVIDLVCAVLILMLERHVRGTAIHTFGSSLFWCSAQLLTVSSQLPNPLSAGARILDVAMEAYAITVVATLAASIGTFLIRRGREADRPISGGGGRPAQ